MEVVKLKTVLAFCLLSWGLTGCAANEDVAPAIVATTGVFTPAEEDFYAERLEQMIASFRSGAVTAIYDSEIEFGQELTASPLPRGEAKRLDAQTLQSLHDYAATYKSASLLIYESGHVVSEAYYADVTADSLINSKSLAKPLGVIAIGRAIKAGHIKSLDQPISDFIIEWQGTDKAAIKVRHLLDMRTGLLEQRYAPETEDVLNRAYLHPRHDEVIIHEYPLINVPGERYDYSNANSELVGIVIERAAGQSYQDFLTDEVLAPLGATGGSIWLNREGGSAHSGCCVGLTSETYLKLAVLVLQKGMWEGSHFLSEDFITQMTTPTPQNKYSAMGVYIGRDYKKDRGAGNPDTPSYAATLHSEPYEDKDIILFDGNGNQVAFIMPSRDIILLRLGEAARIEPPWDNSFMPNLVSRALDGVK